MQLYSLRLNNNLKFLFRRQVNQTRIVKNLYGRFGENSRLFVTMPKVTNI